jgi:hypothetical protein
MKIRITQLRRIKGIDIYTYISLLYIHELQENMCNNSNNIYDNYDWSSI